MEKRIKATKIEVVPSQHQPTSDYTSSAHSVSKATRQAANYQHSPPKSESPSGQVIGWIVGGFIILIVFVGILGGGSGSNSSSSSSSSTPTSSSSSTPTNKYCNYVGCTDSPSGFWEAGTGFCRRHAQLLRDQEKLIDKLKTQGY
jgi:hypothetical protein